MPNSVASKTQRSNSVNVSRRFVGESQILTLQRDADNFTRLLEQEKRKLFGINEAHQMIYKEWKERSQKIKNLKNPTKSDNAQLAMKVGILEREFNQLTLRHNEIQSENAKLRAKIDVHRRERQNFYRVHQNMENLLEKRNLDLKEFTVKSNVSNKMANELQSQIFKLKNKNDEQQEEYLDKFENLQADLKEEKRRANYAGNHPGTDVGDYIDPQEGMKRRLQKIILNNREKVKVIEQYMKHIKIVDEAFNIIRETSGIEDIEEIMSTFIKSEEQNYSLYNYVNILTQSNDNLDEQNKNLQQEFEDLEKELDFWRQQAESTPEDEKQRIRLRDMIAAKDSMINKAKEQLDSIKAPLTEFHTYIEQTPFAGKKAETLEEYEITDENIDQCLAVFEDDLNRMMMYVSKKKDEKAVLTAGILLDQLPKKEFENQSVLNLVSFRKIEANVVMNDVKSQIPDMRDFVFADGHNTDKFLDESKFMEIANESIEKKKQASMINASHMTMTTGRESPTQLTVILHY